MRSIPIVGLICEGPPAGLRKNPAVSVPWAAMTQKSEALTTTPSGCRARLARVPVALAMAAAEEPARVVVEAVNEVTKVPDVPMAVRMPLRLGGAGAVEDVPRLAQRHRPRQAVAHEALGGSARVAQELVADVVDRGQRCTSWRCTSPP